MSIRLTAAAWDLPIGSTEKFVLMCLCDHANDDGLCWPSVARICEKVSKSERTVQTALKWLFDEGYFTIHDGLHKSRTYQIDPRKICTPQNLHPAIIAEKHAKVAPLPRKFRTQTIKNHHEPSLVSKDTKRAKLEKPDAVEQQVWDDFVELRKSKRAPLSETALTAIAREAEKAGWTLNAALGECVGRGWQGFKANWIKENGNGNNGTRANGIRGPRPNPVFDLYLRATEELANQPHDIARDYRIVDSG